MTVRKALLSDLDSVQRICATTISEIYPQYYPKGAVQFFLGFHSEENIRRDIEQHGVFLIDDEQLNPVGTVTIKANEICRLFVLPKSQQKGYGTQLLDYAEKRISEQYSSVSLAASFPAKSLYRQWGYDDVSFDTIQTDNGDWLCYDTMQKSLIQNPLNEDTVRVMKISKEALYEFLYEKFIEGQQDYLKVNATEVINAFDMDWERGEFIFCAAQAENADGEIIPFPKEIDLQKLMKILPDTTDTMFRARRYQDFTADELITLSKNT